MAESLNGRRLLNMIRDAARDYGITDEQWEAERRRVRAEKPENHPFVPHDQYPTCCGTCGHESEKHQDGAR